MTHTDDPAYRHAPLGAGVVHSVNIKILANMNKDSFADDC